MTAPLLLAAAHRLADVFGSEGLGEDVGTHMTCAEAEALADVMRAVGEDAGAAAFLRGHTFGDHDDDDHHLGETEQP